MNKNFVFSDSLLKQALTATDNAGILAANAFLVAMGLLKVWVFNPTILEVVKSMLCPPSYSLLYFLKYLCDVFVTESARPDTLILLTFFFLLMWYKRGKEIDSSTWGIFHKTQWGWLVWQTLNQGRNFVVCNLCGWARVETFSIWIQSPTWPSASLGSLI